MAQGRIGKDYDVHTVIFEFQVEPRQQKELSEKIQGLVHDIVCRQPGFISSHLHLSTDGEKVLNYFQWESKAAFDSFRQDEDKQQHIRPVIGPYGPQPRVYEIVYSTTARRG
ncbi:antibiotic biosynthesis monooxygenase family protein [Neolewinella litorea]|uniref:Antibiotic biosynthesis monooxygenase n=1 Tax=Neolewinella litorea TaxID=2562452 RepID=A0A4V3XKB2_9BACT|nr:antibiotic biosynthesis monooxygenase family protein [Neolewinella litorea]THH36303.1 antibiotic biosynthesis monooxygenase [Neolewinella litorea]